MFVREYELGKMVRSEPLTPEELEAVSAVPKLPKRGARRKKRVGRTAQAIHTRQSLTHEVSCSECMHACICMIVCVCVCAKKMAR